MSKRFTFDITSSFKLECSFAQALCQTLDTPRALCVSLLIQNDEWDQLVDLECDARHYEDASNFADDYLVTELLQKSPNLPLDVDKTQKALDDFRSSEDSCNTTNERLMDPHPDNEPFQVCRVKNLLARTLGTLRTRDLELVQDSFRFGPGATTGVRGSGSVLSDKYDEEIHLTSELMPYYKAVLGDRWWGIRTHPEIVKGNRFTTVPKNAKKNRGICIEPTLNIYMQLGIARLLRSRLRKLGIDLSTQERNQNLARDAYSKNLATIDLSAASDSLSWGCVLKLFPTDWFELLDLVRSPYSEVDGESVELSKFSSMGNGYTFELETLVFAAVAHVCVNIEDQHLISVFGDDIIVPQYAARDVIDTLNYLGFSVNDKKSFLAGNFFESCGTDWFKGQNVRPFYLRQQKDSKIPYAVQIANSLRLYASRRLGGLNCDSRFKDLWVSLYKVIPRDWKQCKVPQQLGDTGIIVAFSERRCSRAKHGVDGWRVRHMRMIPIRKSKKSIGLILSVLDMNETVPPKRLRLGRILSGIACPVTEDASYGREPKRGYLGRPVPEWTICEKWSDGLEW